MKKVITLSLLLWSFMVFSQEYFPKNTGVKTSESQLVALTNATIYASPETIFKNASILIENDIVKEVGKNINIPETAQVIDLKGYTVYPSFIEAYSSFGMKQIKRESNKKPQYDANRKGYYWNDHIRPETKAENFFTYDNKKAKELLKIGFGVVNTHLDDGIAQGTSILVALDQKGNNGNRVLQDNVAQHFSFNKSKFSHQKYPSSLMGSLALLKQVAYDAKYYAAGKLSNTDKSLEAYNTNAALPAIFKSGNYLNSLRIHNLSTTTGIKYTVVGSGDEYKRIDAIKNSKQSFIIPINFPEAYDVSDHFIADQVSLKDMKHWNLAPSNPMQLEKHNIPFALTAHQLKKAKDFPAMLQKAIQYGLSEKEALKALTTFPASLLKNNKIGSLKNGNYANFIITSGNIFDSKTKIYEHWILGKPNTFIDRDKVDIRGEYNLTLNNKTFSLDINGEIHKPKIKVSQDTLNLKGKIKYQDNWINISFNEKEANTYYRLSSLVQKDNTNLTGNAILPNGVSVSFAAIKKDEEKKQIDSDKKESSNKHLTTVSYPNMAYGFTKQPKAQNMLIKNTTVWTNEKEGVVKNTDVWIKDGKIYEIGENLSGSNAIVIDGTGKHLTTGIVDEHSHIATSSVNESGHNSTAEVSIADVVNPDDINIYRNLAGGVTTLQILHGSANPIGGQSALVKLKWGETANNMLINNAPKFIKFALGENVKQSNWGNTERIRFPQTRMGVEQVFRDYFSQAKEYGSLKNSGLPYRKDLELETLLEIINKERFISCHSYIQSEITMLMRVAEEFGFSVNTFTHILEGYKVADKMKAHGAGGSTFSDWWAYKYEVNDAIPYNGAIMHNAGVTVAFNSDDAEMSRRLNQEAAKAIKYGNISEEDAWKFVTLNPAKLLHLDDRLGSIKPGKDADLVLWSHNPLSVYAKAEKTIIEGVVYFDIERDQKLRKSIQEERNTLINQMIHHKNAGGKTQSAKKKQKRHIHCDFEGNLN